MPKIFPIGQFQRDFIRVVASLFAPMLVGAVVIPLVVILFNFVGRQS